MLVMVLFKNVVRMGMDYHHSTHIMQVRKESSAKKLPEEYGQEDDPKKFLKFLDISSLHTVQKAHSNY